MRLFFIFFFCFIFYSNVDIFAADQVSKALKLSKVPKLPKDIKWLTNDKDPEYSSPKAKKGGRFNTFLLSFPLTLRHVGPDSNTSFRSVILENQMSLVNIHPNTDNIIPGVATHWAFANDHKTVYYKLNPKAKWSDGKPVTADDFIFTIEFMRSKNIMAPWYNEYYGNYFDKVIKYDNHTIAVVGKEPKPKKDLVYYYGLIATPKHYYKLDKNFVSEYNWKIAPNTGPYFISKVVKGKYIELKRKKNWWAKDLKYYRNRFNVDKIRFKVIRDMNVAFQHFQKGNIDSFALILPEFWHKKAKGELYDKGYIHKLWFYTDSPQPNMGIWFNQAIPLFNDLNVRKAFSHAFNIKKMIDTVLRGEYSRAETGFEGHGKYNNTSIVARKFDLKKVDFYLKKAGWNKRGPDGIRVKDGKKLSVKVNYGIDKHTDRLVFLKEEAKKAGIELVLQLQDPSTSFKTVLEKKHEIAWSGWGATYRPQFWGQFHSVNADKPQTNNITNTKNKTLDKLIDAYRKEANEKNKIELCHKIQKIIHDEATFVPLYYVPYFREAYWRYWQLPEVPATKLSDSAFSLFGDSGGLFWFDQKIYDETKKAMDNKKSFGSQIKVDETFKIKNSENSD